MINRIIISMFLLLFNIANGRQFIGREKIIGEWKIEGKKRLISNGEYLDRRIEPLNQETLSIFKNGTLEFASGIYFPTVEEWPQGHYPWIYCGSITFYRMIGDEFFELYNPVEKSWLRFQIAITQDQIKLSNGKDDFSLIRLTKSNGKKNYEIKRLELTYAASPYSLHKKLIFYSNDLMSVINYGEPGNKNVFYKIKLPDGYFNYLANSLNEYSVFELKNEYMDFVDGRLTEFVVVTNGKKKSISSEGDLPDLLKIIELRMIHAEDLVNYPGLGCEINYVNHNKVN